MTLPTRLEAMTGPSREMDAQSIIDGLTEAQRRTENGVTTKVIAAARRAIPKRNDPPRYILDDYLLRADRIGYDLQRDLPLVLAPQAGWQVAEWLLGQQIATELREREVKGE